MVVPVNRWQVVRVNRWSTGGLFFSKSFGHRPTPHRRPGPTPHRRHQRPTDDTDDTDATDAPLTPHRRPTDATDATGAPPTPPTRDATDATDGMTTVPTCASGCSESSDKVVPSAAKAQPHFSSDAARKATFDVFTTFVKPLHRASSWPHFSWRRSTATTSKTCLRAMRMSPSSATLCTTSFRRSR